MAEDRTKLQEALRDIEERIEELEKRIPPHSVKPHLIQQLDDLEAERDQIAALLNGTENS